MKKIFSIVICTFLVVLFSISCTFNVAATEIYQGGYDEALSGENTGEITVTAHQYSRYSISIPETLDTNDMSSEIIVSNASLEEGKVIFVSVTNMDDDFTIPVTHKTKSGVTGKIAIGGNYGNAQRRDIICKFDGAELENNNGTDSANVHINIVGQPEAGEYKGVITYAVTCVDNPNGNKF